MTLTSNRLVICRAADADPEGAHAEVRLTHEGGEPTQEQLDRYERGILDTFRTAFEHEPARVAVVVLPWVADDERDDG